MVATQPTNEQMNRMDQIAEQRVNVLYYSGHDRVDVAYLGSRVKEFEDAESVEEALTFAEGFAAALETVGVE